MRPAPGPRLDLEPRVPGHPRSITELAMDANLSGHQRKTALRVANVPKEEFEALVYKQGAARVPGAARSALHAGPRVNAFSRPTARPRLLEPEAEPLPDSRLF